MNDAVEFLINFHETILLSLSWIKLARQEGHLGLQRSNKNKNKNNIHIYVE